MRYDEISLDEVACITLRLVLEGSFKLLLKLFSRHGIFVNLEIFEQSPKLESWS